MKKISIIALMACTLLTTSCETDNTLEDTRVADVEAPSITLAGVNVNKYDATFDITLGNVGNPTCREYGVLVSREAQPTVENSTILVADNSSTTASLTQTLSPGTTYYVCAYALTANQVVMSEIKSFTTDPHPLGAFIGKKMLSGLNLHVGGDDSFMVNLATDKDDESVLYMSGLSSNAGVSLVLNPVKLVFDLANNTVTIPDKQIIEEKNYGAYRYVGMNEETNPLGGDIVGVIENGQISFDALGAMIVEGGNAGLFHWAYFNITIQ